jgi:hypothetical protein
MNKKKRSNRESNPEYKKTYEVDFFLVSCNCFALAVQSGVLLLRLFVHGHDLKEGGKVTMKKKKENTVKNQNIF